MKLNLTKDKTNYIKGIWKDVIFMIPKKIHYVWVGGKEKPKDIKRCMKTWRKYLPDYEFKEWNEANFDIEAHPFCRDAYKAKKWAFVSDYIRAYAIYNEGGIYLDTDNLVIRNLDDLRKNRAFVGYEHPEAPFTACFGAEKHHPFLKDMLDFYDSFKFEFDKNNQLKDTNTRTVSDLLVDKYNCKLGNIEQELKNGLKVYKDDILCNPSINSYTIHVFTGTWLEGKKTLKYKISKFFKLRIDTPKKAEFYRKYIGRGYQKKNN